MTPPPFDVAIIGGGASGVLTASQLRRQHPNVSVALIDATGSGRGLAYGTPHLVHLLNVPAGNMSAFPDQPDHFLDWLKATDPLATPATYAPRKAYGDYLGHILQEACRAPSRVESVTGTAVAVERSAGGWRVRLHSGRCLDTKAVVLALGNLPPAEPSVMRGFTSDQYFGDPWIPGAVSLGGQVPVLLIGTGLTAIDIVLALRAEGHTGTIHAISRRGLLPRSHAPRTLRPPAGTLPMDSAHAMLKWLRQEIGRAESEGQDWRGVVDGLRPHTARIWGCWGDTERARFLRHARAWWEVHRHRAAPDVALTIDRLRQEGSLRIHRGRLLSVRESDAGIRVRWRGPDGKEAGIEVGRVINCTGPVSDYGAINLPLVAQLRRDGWLTPDHLGLGVETDTEGRLLGTDGKNVEDLYAIGPLRKPALWESTAMPEIRVQAEALARRLGQADRPD